MNINCVLIILDLNNILIIEDMFLFSNYLVCYTSLCILYSIVNNIDSLNGKKMLNAKCLTNNDEDKSR